MLRLLEESPKYRELDEETLELLSVVVDEPRIWENRSNYKQEGMRAAISCMMKNLHLTMEQALEALEIPRVEWERYLQ